jgi:uncharacterized protein YigE (DUF2233 family)
MRIAKNKNLHSALLVAILSFLFVSFQNENKEEDHILSYTVDPKKQVVKMYWKDDHGNIFNSIKNLKIWLEKKDQRLIFAMNGGMFNYDHAPQGLYVENNILMNAVDTSSGRGNFYLKPNGIFYLTSDGAAEVCKTEDFQFKKSISYATQSGSMLVVDGKIHPAFKHGSNNLNIRNGVGILPDHKILFAMSKREINFYDFANFFKEMGCRNA